MANSNPPQAGQWFYIQSKFPDSNGNNQLVTVQGGDAYPGATIQLWPLQPNSNNGYNGLWKYEDGRIVSAIGSLGLVLDASSYIDPNTWVVLNAANSDSSQQWIFNDDGTITNQSNNGLVLDSAGGSAGTGEWLEVDAAAQGSPTQQFSIAYLPAQVFCSADMIEDYNNAMLPPCTPTPNAFCALTNANGQTELLTISDDGQLLWIYPDSTVSSGWSHITTPFIGCTSTPSWLTGFYTFNESGGPPLIMVFYGTNLQWTSDSSDSVNGMQYDGATWTAVQLSSDAANLLQAAQLQLLMSIPVDIGEPVPRVLVYGVAIDMPVSIVYFLGPAPKTNIWSVYSAFKTEAWNSALAGWLPDAGMTVWTCGVPSIDYLDHAQNQEWALQDWSSATIDWNNASITSSDYGNSTTAPGFTEPMWTTPVPCTQGFNSFIDLDSATHAITQWSVTVGDSSSTTATPLQGGDGQPQAGIMLGTGLMNGLLVGFALEKGTNLLWMLQQTDADGIGHFTWTQLGDYGTAIAVPPTMSVPQVIIYDDTGNISLLSQNTDGSWFKNVMATPTQTSQPPVSATTYTFEFTTADVNGNPVPNMVLSIEPDTPQTLVINQIAYQATPGTPVLGVADAFGRVTVAALAGALASPELTVEICGIQGNSNGAPPVSAGTFRADYLLHNRMAGNDTQFPVDSQTYINAGLLPSNIDPDTASSFCNNMQTLSQGAVNMVNGQDSPAAMAARSSSRAFVFDFSTRGSMICRDLTAEELAAHRARRPAPDSIFGDLWGDIAHFFKHAWQQVEKVVVDIGDDITIAINDLDSYVMKVIDDIRDAIEVVLQALNNLVEDVVDFVKKAIEWLKALFDWQDIINTKDVFKWFFQQNAANLQQLLSTSGLQTWIDSQFANLTKDVTNAFGQLEGLFGGSTFNGMTPASSSNPMLSGGPPLQAASLQQQWQTNSVKINYVTNKVSDLSMAPGGSVEAMVSAFEAAFTGDQIQNSLAALGEQIESIHSLSDFLNATICTLLIASEAIVMLVLDAIQGIIDAILTAASAALQAALQVLENEIDIPIISYLYQAITGSQLTILDLLCLILAVPCTILYKIFFGGSDATAPFTSDQTSALTSSNFTWPWLGNLNPSIQTLRPTVEPQDQGPPNEALTILSTLGIIVGFATAVTDVAGDMLNLGTEDNPAPDKEVTKLIGWTNVVTTFIQTCIYLPWSLGFRVPMTTANDLDFTGSMFPLVVCSPTSSVCSVKSLRRSLFLAWGPPSLACSEQYSSGSA